MTKRNTWLCTIFTSALFWAGLSFVGAKALADIPTGDVELVPSIEFNCNGLHDVMLTNTGLLTVNGKIYRLSSGYLNKMVFTDNIILEGELDGEQLYFDHSHITVDGHRYTCRAE
jgi:hypothetical protein